jgi:hypothetical protein
MSQAHVELVRKAFEAFKFGGMEAVLPFYTPDVVCYPVSEWLEDPVYRGHVREVEEQVVVLAELTGQVRDSGVPIRQAFGVIHSDFRDGTTGEVRYVTSSQLALEDRPGCRTDPGVATPPASLYPTEHDRAVVHITELFGKDSVLLPGVADVR